MKEKSLKVVHSVTPKMLDIRMDVAELGAVLCVIPVALAAARCRKSDRSKIPGRN